MYNMLLFYRERNETLHFIMLFDFSKSHTFRGWKAPRENYAKLPALLRSRAAVAFNRLPEEMDSSKFS